jgi:hypothetical protein
VSYAGLLGLSALYGLVGLSFLRLLGLTSARPASWLDLPLSIVTGWALTGVVLSLVLIAGGDIAAGLVTAGALAGVASIISWRKPMGAWSFLPARPSRVGWVAGAVMGGFLTLFVLRGLWWPGNFHPDVWSFWIPKAKAIYYFGGLDTGLGGFTDQVHPDYPPMVPAIDAAVFTVTGHSDPLVLPLHYSLLDVAFVLAVVSILQRRVGLDVALVSGAVLAALPGFIVLVGSALGDESLVVAATLAVLVVCTGAETRESRFILLAAVFLGAATLVKNEGAMLSLAVVLAAVISRLVRGQRQIAALAGAPAAAFILWRGWIRANHVPLNPDLRLGRLLHPLWLVHHTHHLRSGIGGLLHQSVGMQWAFVLPVLILVALSAGRRSNETSRFSLLVIGFWLLGYAAIYWVSIDAPWTAVAYNVQRVYSPIAVTAAALVPIVLLPANPSDAAEDWRSIMAKIRRPGSAPASRGPEPHQAQ